MAARELVTVVFVTDDDGESHRFGPGDDVPAWAASRITNPKAWRDGDVPQAERGEVAVEEEAEEPPRNGAGSGRDAWVAYAESVGVEVDEDMSRDDIVAAVDAAGE